MAEEEIDVKTARVVLEVPRRCEHCKGNGQVPGGLYKHEGEVVVCPRCDGKKKKQVSVSMGAFYELMFKAVNAPGRR